MTSDPGEAHASARRRRTLWRALAVVAVLVMLAPVALAVLGELSRARDTAAAVTAHLARARAASDAGRFEAATVALEAAHALTPGDPAVQRAAMVVAVTRAAQRPSLVQDAELDALDYALTALADDGGAAVPASTRLVATRLLAERRGDAVAALAGYGEAVKLAPDDAYAHLAVARLQRQAGRRVEALAAFEAAVAAAPKNLTARNNLGVLYAELGRTDDAVAAFQAAIAVEDNVASRTNLATILAGAERLEEAVEHMRHAIALAPASAEAYRRLGQLLTLTGRHAEAEAALLKSLDLANDPQTGVALGRLYQVQGRHDQAVAVFSAVLEAKRDAFDAGYLLGISLRALGREAEAATAFRHYLRSGSPGREGASPRCRSCSRRPRHRHRPTRPAPQWVPTPRPEPLTAARIAPGGTT